MFGSNVKEDLLYYVWRTKSFVKDNLTTTCGKPLHIIRYGSQNDNSGPDFFNGRIVLDGLEWSGNIEMHVRSSDWNRHGHSADKAYNNVILHVVFEEDEDIYDNAGRLLPCLEMQSLIPSTILKNYGYLRQSETKIPCENIFPGLDHFPLYLALEGLAIERIRNKTAYLNELLESYYGDWEEVLYIGLSRYMGARINMQPFEQLARTTPLRMLQKQRNQIFALESILFGQAGMLEADFEEPYFKELKREYAFQQKKFTLRPLPVSMWKFGRLRPANFPTIRIAQFATILHQHIFSFQTIKEEERLETIIKMFEVTASEYWDTHYLFGKSSPSSKKKPGKQFASVLIINVVIPILFLYGIRINNQNYKDKAIRWLMQLKGEINHITRLFKKLGFPAHNALETQAVIQLKSSLCDQRQCLSCPIGNQILHKTRPEQLK